MRRNKKISHQKHAQGSPKYLICQKALNRALAIALKVPLSELSTLADKVTAEYLSKVIKSESSNEQPKILNNGEETNDAYILPDNTPNTTDHDDTKDTKIQEMKYEKINYKCEKCGYISNFFCSFQLHIETCAARDRVPKTDPNLKIVISLPEAVKKQLYNASDFCRKVDCEEHSHSDVSEDSNNSGATDTEINESVILSTDDCSSNTQEFQSEKINTNQIVVKECPDNEFDTTEQDRIVNSKLQINHTEQINDIIEENNVLLVRNPIISQIEQGCITKQPEIDDSSLNNALSIRLIGRHFPSYLPATNAKEVKLGLCAVCFNKTDEKNERIKKKTRYCCKVCGVSLCVVPCFRVYHTEIHF